MSQVYTTFSRRPPSQVHRALTDLKVEYLVLSSQWCLTTERGGCALTEVSWILFPLTLHGWCAVGQQYDMMITTLRSGILRNPGLRRQAVLQHVPHSGTGLSQNSVSTKFDRLSFFLDSRPPLPFLSVFSNQEYKVLRVNPRVLEIKSKKSEKI